MYEVFELLISLIWLGIVFSFGILLYALACIGRMRMFQKAGVQGWKAWIPFYSDYVLCAITMGRGWYFVFGWIPLLAPIMRAVYAVEVSLSYRQGVLFGVLYFFLPTVAELVAGFGSAPYVGTQDLEAQIRNLFHGGPANGGGSAGGYYTGAPGTDNAHVNGANVGSGTSASMPGAGSCSAGPEDAGTGNV